jgi:outer membrane protein assembly factor BamB
MVAPVVGTVVLAAAVCADLQTRLDDLVAKPLLAAAGLETLWQGEVPMKTGEQLERLHIRSDCIYALSSRNYMVGMNRFTGSVIFAVNVAPEGLPICGLRRYGDSLLSVIGNELVELAADSGQRVFSRRLSFGVSCPPGRNSSHYYIAGADNRMHVLRADDMVKLFDVAADDDSGIIWVEAYENAVLFATDSGSVVSMAASEPKKLWQFDAAAGIVPPFTVGGDALYFASFDTNVYKLDLDTGILAWRYQAGAVLDRAPCVTSAVLYQYAREKGVFAVAVDAGAFLWQLPSDMRLLAEAGGRAYMLGDERLVVVDNKRRKPLHAVNFAGVDRLAANTSDGRIYIADSMGKIACLSKID